MSNMGFVHSKQKSAISMDPRTKLLLLIIINVVMMAGGIQGIEFYARIILAVMPLFLILTQKRYGASVLYTIILMFSFVLEGFVVQHTTGYVNLIFLLVSGIVSRLVPGFVMGYYVMTTTTVSEFIAAMEKMHLSKKIIIPISVMFRYFPTIAEENKAIASAMKMRGIGLRGKNGNPITLMEYRLVPVMMSTVKIGDELSAASLTKGLDGDVKRTNVCVIGFHWLDVLFCAIAVACLVCFLWM